MVQFRQVWAGFPRGAETETSNEEQFCRAIKTLCCSVIMCCTIYILLVQNAWQLLTRQISVFLMFLLPLQSCSVMLRWWPAGLQHCSGVLWCAGGGRLGGRPPCPVHRYTATVFCSAFRHNWAGAALDHSAAGQLAGCAVQDAGSPHRGRGRHPVPGGGGRGHLRWCQLSGGEAGPALRPHHPAAALEVAERRNFPRAQVSSIQCVKVEDGETNFFSIQRKKTNNTSESRF